MSDLAIREDIQNYIERRTSDDPYQHTNLHPKDLEAMRWLTSQVGVLTANLDAWKAASNAQTDELKSLREMLINETRARSTKPDFGAFVELKHGIVGTILWALQNGEISRSKAAEALAEVAHGAIEVRLPDVPDAIPERVTPLELWQALKDARVLLCSEGDPNEDGAMIEKIDAILKTGEKAPA
jgi:hypothetical protein